MSGNENSITEIDKKNLNHLVDELEKTEIHLRKLKNIYNELETILFEKRTANTLPNKKSSNNVGSLPKKSSSIKVSTKSSKASVVQKSSLRLSEGYSKTSLSFKRSVSNVGDFERAVSRRIEEFHAIRTRLRKMDIHSREEKKFLTLLNRKNPACSSRN